MSPAGTVTVKSPAASIIPKVCRLDRTATIMIGLLQTTPKVAQPMVMVLSLSPDFTVKKAPPLIFLDSIARQRSSSPHLSWQSPFRPFPCLTLIRQATKYRNGVIAAKAGIHKGLDTGSGLYSRNRVSGMTGLRCLVAAVITLLHFSRITGHRSQPRSGLTLVPSSSSLRHFFISGLRPRITIFLILPRPTEGEDQR